MPAGQWRFIWIQTHLLGLWRRSPRTQLPTASVKLAGSGFEELHSEQDATESSYEIVEVQEEESATLNDFDDQLVCGTTANNNLTPNCFRSEYSPEQSSEGIETSDVHEGLVAAEGAIASGSTPQDDHVGETVPTVSIGLLASSESENRLIMHVEVSGRCCDALIDTGATTSMVSSQWLRASGIGYKQDHPANICGFGVDNVLLTVGQVWMPLTIGGLTLPLQRFSVVEAQQAGTVALILAEDFLQSNHMIVDPSNRRLRQYSGKGFIDFYANEGQPPTRITRRVACTVAADCMVSATDWTTVKVDGLILTGTRDPCEAALGSEEPGDLLFEPSMSGAPVSTLPGFIDLEVPTVLAMASKKMTFLKKGDVLGTLSTVLSLPALEQSGEVCVATASGATGGPTHPLPDHLTAEEKEVVAQLLEKQGEVFSYCDEDVGQLGLTKHRIELLDDTPIYQKSRRFPEPVSEEIEAQCQELHLLDIIEPSKSAWSSPIVPVRKKDGKLRLCVDYRKLNAVTKPDRYPLPNLTDSVYSLHGVKFFSCVDVVRGFYHLQLEEASKEITAFSSPRGHWQFKRLPFGLRNAPSAFQREMQCILSSFSHHNVIVYIDDVLIMSESFEEHVKMVGKVLATLIKYGVKIKPSKCKWFEREVEYLGHVIGRDGIKKAPSFMDKVKKFPRPETVRQLREFLGLANFQRKFVPNFSEVQKPLSVETGGRGKKRLRWTAEMDAAFIEIKKRIVEDVTLAFPDYGEGGHPLELYVDASGVGAGACLAQRQNEEIVIIAYASTTFSPAEYHYSTIERELAALRWGVKALRPFIIGTEFILHTDHQPLIYLHNMKIIDSRLARTLEDLSDFNFRIQYTPGKQNAAADALSRLHTPHWEDQLRVQMEPRKLPAGLLVIKEVPGGGDSLFESLHILARNDASLAGPACVGTVELRELLVDELLRRPEQYKITLDREQRRTLKLMRLPGQLAGIEILYAFAQLFRCLVIVHYGGDWGVTFMSPLAERNWELPRAHLQCLAGVHYNPVIELAPETSNSYTRPEDTLECPSSPCQETNIEEGLLDDETQDNITYEEVQLSTTGNHEMMEFWCQRHVKAHSVSVLVNIDGNRYCSLLDSGAQVSCIALDVIRTYDIPINETVRYVINGLGTGTSPMLGVADVEFNFPGLGVVNHSLAVVPEDSMPYCMILGVDFLVAHGLLINYGNCALEQEGQIVCQFSAVIGETVQAADLSLRRSVMPLTILNCERGTVEDKVQFSVEDGPNGEPVALMSLQEVRKLQKKSSVLATVKRQLSRGERQWPKRVVQFRRYREDLAIRDGVLFHGNTPVVTFSVLVEVVLVVHHHMAHIGRQKLIEITRGTVWHPSITKVASDVSASCDWCQRMKVASIIAPPVHKIETSVPFELVTLDLLNLPRSGGCGAALVVVDHNSKWLSVVPLSSKTSASVGSAFERRVLPCLPRKPDKVLSDNGPEFVGSAFNNMLSSYCIEHAFTTPNRPPSNGLVERTNRTLSELLRLESRTDEGWTEWLAGAILVYNHTFHTALGCSPSEYLLQREHAVRATPIIPADLAEKWREGNPSFVTFRVGQLVLKKTVMTGNDTTNKFKARFQGPFEVAKVNMNGITYQIRDLATDTVIRAHHGQLRSYVEVPGYIRSHPCYQSLMSRVSGKAASEDTEGVDQSSHPAGTSREARVFSVLDRWCSSDEDTTDSFSGFSRGEDDDSEMQFSTRPRREDISWTDSDGCTANSFSGFSSDPDGVFPEMMNTQSGSSGSGHHRLVVEARPALKISDMAEVDLDRGLSMQSSCSRDDNPLLMEFPEEGFCNYYSFCIPEYEFSYDPVAHNLFNASGSVLQRGAEVSPGVVVDREEEFWDMEAALGVEMEPAVLPWMDQGSDAWNDLRGKSLNSFELRLRLSSSSSISFSGFEAEGSDSLGTVLQMLEDRVHGMVDQNCQIRVTCHVPPRGNPQLQSPPVDLGHSQQSPTTTTHLGERRPRLLKLRSPIATRSRGAVPALPYVQPTTLEYKLRRGDSTDLDSC